MHFHERPPTHHLIHSIEISINSSWVSQTRLEFHKLRDLTVHLFGGERDWGDFFLSSSFLLRVGELGGWVWVTRVSFFLFGDSGLVSEGVWVGPFISFSGWVDCWVGVGGFRSFFGGGFWIGGRGDLGGSFFFLFSGWLGGLGWRASWEFSIGGYGGWFWAFFSALP